MKRLWLWYLPFLFVPSLGFGLATPFGTLEIIDFLSIPFIALLYFSPSIDAATLRGEIKRVGLLFVLWAFATILWMYLRYEYEKPIPVLLFSLLKLGKFSMYGFIGLSISYHLVNEETKAAFHMALLGAGLILGASLALVVKATEALGQTSNGHLVAALSYKTNLISAGMAVIFVYILTLYLRKYGSPLWRRLAPISLAVMFIGSSFSGGRGGWMAAIAGLSYVALHLRIKARTVLIIMTFLSGAFTVYETNPDFQSQVDRTLFPNQTYLETYKIGVAGVDDGGRVSTWIHEISKLPRSPIFGTGFYHRGEKSGLWITGSHNFWLQMFLETGLVGGIIILFLLWKMWKHAEQYSALNKEIALALKAALITAFVGGMSGEYFYGSYGLLCLILVYACVGSGSRSLVAPSTNS